MAHRQGLPHHHSSSPAQERGRGRGASAQAREVDREGEANRAEQVPRAVWFDSRGFVYLFSQTLVLSCRLMSSEEVDEAPPPDSLRALLGGLTLVRSLPRNSAALIPSAAAPCAAAPCSAAPVSVTLSPSNQRRTRSMSKLLDAARLCSSSSAAKHALATPGVENSSCERATKKRKH